MFLQIEKSKPFSEVSGKEIGINNSERKLRSLSDAIYEETFHQPRPKFPNDPNVTLKQKLKYAVLGSKPEPQTAEEQEKVVTFWHQYFSEKTAPESNLKLVRDLQSYC